MVPQTEKSYVSVVRRTFVYVKTESFKMYFLAAVEHTEKDEKTFDHNRFYVFLEYVPVQEVYGKYT